MRIISGLFKGKKILQPADKMTRPLKDLTKESVFNVIKHSNLLRTLQQNNSSDRYFSVSTDKAANPVSLMGASKKIMEVFFSSINKWRSCFTKWEKCNSKH